MIPGSGRSPKEGRHPTPVFLPGKSHGQRSLIGPGGLKELGMTIDGETVETVAEFIFWGSKITADGG